MNIDFFPNLIDAGNVEIDEFFVYFQQINPFRIILGTTPIKVIKLINIDEIEAIIND